MDNIQIRFTPVQVKINNDGGCLTPLSIIFQLYRGGQFYSWGKPGYQEKTITLPKVTDNLISHNVV
jgi:hypothetical protein